MARDEGVTFRAGRALVRLHQFAIARDQGREREYLGLIRCMPAMTRHGVADEREEGGILLV